MASTPSPTPFGLWIASMHRREAFRAHGATRMDPRPPAGSVVLGYSIYWAHQRRQPMICYATRSGDLRVQARPRRLARSEKGKNIRCFRARPDALGRELSHPSGARDITCYMPMADALGEE